MSKKPAEALGHRAGCRTASLPYEDPSRNWSAMNYQASGAMKFAWT
ncbi:MAG: hypothetical protein U5K69_28910 [Balneolaceae bacterium]|nr:hypothetical protein [Balneolaceae bacterium]